MVSLNRNLAAALGQSAANDTVSDTGAPAGGLTIFDSIGEMTATTATASSGELGLLRDSNLLYVHNGSGWFKMAVINTSPSFSTSPETTYELSNTGAVTTITILATDPEGLPITYSASGNNDFNGLATVSQDSSVFTITPLSEDSATTTSGILTFTASDGVNLATATSTFSLVFKVENANYTRLLIKASGNSGTNTSITDSSSNSHSLTINGNTHASSLSPYSSGGYSYYFNGSSDYLYAAASSDFAFGTGDFTIEFWAYITNTTTSRILTNRATQTGAAGTWSLTLNYNTIRFTEVISGEPGPTANIDMLNRWAHIAVARSSGTTKIFVDGIEIASATQTTNFSNSSYNLHIGTSPNENYREGYFSDIRIVKGTALYTSNFTPPTERLTAVSGTVLLTCHLPYLVDGSSAARTININSVRATAFSPYLSYAYSASSYGGSVYYDGTGDYIDFSPSSDFGSSDFTIEAWLYPTDSTAYRVVSARNSNSGLTFGRAANGTFSIFYGNGTAYLDIANVVPLNVWTHAALVRESGTAKVYINGIFKGSVDWSGKSFTSTTYRIGNSYDTRNETFDGNVSDLQMISGTAKYTANFTPNTSPISTASGAMLHLKGQDAKVYDASQNKVITLAGNTSSSTGQTKYASSSVYFDGTGDYATISYDAELTKWWTKPYTIEAWIYPTNLANWGYDASYRPNLICHGTHNSTINYWSFGTSDDGAVYFYYWNGAVNDVKSTTGLVTANTWSHIAMTHNNGVINLYHNGTHVKTANVSGTPQESSSYPINIGMINNVGIIGYVEDLRITTGLSRYSYIPAKETLSVDANTILLTAHASSVTDGTSNSSPTASGNAAVTTHAPKQGMYSIDFDGTDDKVSISNPNTAFGSLTGDYTIECWVNMDAVPSGDGNGDENQIIGQSTWPENATSGNWWVLFAVASGVYFYTADGSNYTAHHATAMSWTVGKWTHIAVVKSSGTVSVYIDGSLQTSGSNDDTLIADNNRALTIGNDAGNTNDFNGQISNLRVSNTARYTSDFTPPSSALV